MRAVCISIAALTTFAVVLPLAGCGSGSGTLRAAPTSSVTRKKGTLTMTVVWPARTRLIPDAANSIQVTITRRPDADISTATPPMSVLLVRPANFSGSSSDSTPPTSTATFNNGGQGIDLGTYDITVVAYPGTTGPGTPNPATGVNVPVASTAGTATVGVGNNTINLTMDSTIAQLVPNLDATFPRDANGNLILQPNQSVQFNIIAYDATPTTATPPGPYRVLFTPSKLQYTVSSQTGVNVSVSSTGLVTAGNLTSPTVGGSAVIKVTDSESGKFSTITVLVNPAGLSTVAQWARFHGDSQNTGQVTNLSVPVLDPKLRGVAANLHWPLITGSQIDFSSPTIAADGTVYIGTITKDFGGSAGDKTLYAINPDGTLKWTFNDSGNLGNIEGSPTLAQDGTIFVGSENGTVYAIKDVPNSANGTPYTLLWKNNLGKSAMIDASVAIGKNNTVYVATSDASSSVYAFSGYTGQPIQAKQPDGSFKPWVFTGATGGIYGAPALSLDPNESVLYVSTYTGSVYAVGTGTGSAFGATAIWSVSLNSGNIMASPSVSRIGTEESVIVATLGGYVFALQGASGATTDGWPSTGYNASAPIYTTPAIKEDTPTLTATKKALFIYVATFDNTSGTNDHKVVAINATNGVQQWRTPVGQFTNGFTSSPALSSNGLYLYIGNYDGALYAVDATNDTNPQHGLAQFTDTDGTVKDWKFQTPSGSGNAPTNNLDSSPGVDSAGHVYIGGYDGSVYSVGINPANP
jgi:outer membrane protein assembly factor BamB